MSPLIALLQQLRPDVPLPLAHLERVGQALQLQQGPAGRVSSALWDTALLDPARSFLAEPGKGFRARLVELGWGLAGGQPGSCPPELAVTLEWLHAGSLIVDDIEDGAETRRGKPALHISHGMPRALNTANWLYFAALQHLASSGLPQTVVCQLQSTAISALASCHCGQALDLSARVGQLAQGEVADVVAATTALKTGALMGLAAELGAVAAGGDAQTVAALAQFGRQLGSALQMLDDAGSVLSVAREAKGVEDLRGAHPTWVWAWLAQDVDPFTWARLMNALHAVEAGADPTELVVELRRRMEHVGRSRPAQQLSRTCAQLRTFTGEHPYLQAVQAEIERLKESYV